MDKKKDENEIAFDIVNRVTSSRKPNKPHPAVSEAARALSKLGAHLGGHARAKSLSKSRRKSIAQKAAAARWSKREK